MLIVLVFVAGMASCSFPLNPGTTTTTIPGTTTTLPSSGPVFPDFTVTQAELDFVYAALASRTTTTTVAAPVASKKGVASSPALQYRVSDRRLNSSPTDPQRIEESAETYGFYPTTDQPAVKILVLLYHGISATDEEKDIAGNIRYQRWTTRFRQDLDYIIANGYMVIGYDDLFRIQNGTLYPPDPKLVIICFDDGRASQSEAIAILKAYGFKANFSLITDKVGKTIDGISFMGWPEIKAAASYQTPDGKYLFSFSSHSDTHSRLIPATLSAAIDAGTATDITNYIFSNETELRTYLTFLKREMIRSSYTIRHYVPESQYQPMLLMLPEGHPWESATGNLRTIVQAMAVLQGFDGVRTSDAGDYSKGAPYGAFNAYTQNLFKIPCLSVEYYYTGIPLAGFEQYFANVPD